MWAESRRSVSSRALPSARSARSSTPAAGPAHPAGQRADGPARPPTRPGPAGRRRDNRRRTRWHPSPGSFPPDAVRGPVSHPFASSLASRGMLHAGESYRAEAAAQATSLAHPPPNQGPATAPAEDGAGKDLPWGNCRPRPAFYLDTSSYPVYLEALRHLAVCGPASIHQELASVTKKQIVQMISEETGLTQLQTKDIVDQTFEAIVKTLLDGRPDRAAQLRRLRGQAAARPARPATPGPATRSTSRPRTSSPSSPARRWKRRSASSKRSPAPARPPREEAEPRHRARCTRRPTARPRRPPRTPARSRQAPARPAAEDDLIATYRANRFKSRDRQIDDTSPGKAVSGGPFLASPAPPRRSAARLARGRSAIPFTVRRGGICVACSLSCVAACALHNAGCFLNQYSSDPNRRMMELLNQSEDLRQIELEWERFWMIDQPSHMTYDRVHGGIG